ncbi:hypothetical protein BV898_18602 [Hypsibius exemplaris]|uniref:Uncharacterized protein n=1 Tax=Hypsibius exemplaris TaxID=2072580 RepID=A0A9X6NQG2_HYPEX|nr:hypothetical protein BV898_18602 [Hypsibius exemplaris]
MIHHSAYLTRTETYVTVGSQQLHYCRYWQELISDWPLLIFIYKFCGDFQDIGLSQTEKYLLLAVIMFEPDIDEPERNTENYILKLEYLHKHYTDVLFQVLKSGRTDGDLNRTCRRLEEFFNSLRKIYQMHGEYSRVLEDSSVNQHPAQSATTSIWWRKYHLFDRSGHVERRFSMWEPSKLLMK